MSRREDEPMNTPDDEMFRAEWDAGGHVSEDTVHAWLDRQLGTNDANAVESHVESCADCAELVAEARGLKAATARIVGSLDVVPGGIVPREDVARTASHIVALATAAEKSERARNVVVKKFWQNPVVLRAAAAIVLMVGATTVVMRVYSPTSTSAIASMDSSTAAPIISSTSPVPQASAVPAAAPTTGASTAASTDAASKVAQSSAAPSSPPLTAAASESNRPSALLADARARQAPQRVEPVDSISGPPVAFRAASKPASGAVKKLKEEPLAKSSRARAENEQRGFAIAKADSGVARRMADAVGRGAVANAGNAAGVGTRPGSASLNAVADAPPPTARVAVVAPPVTAPIPVTSPPAATTGAQTASQATSQAPPVPPPAKVVAEVATASDKSRADTASTAAGLRSFAGGGRGGRAGSGGGRAAGGVGSLSAQKILDTASALSTPITIVGKVIDDAGKPLPGATVVVNGTTLGSITTAKGDFLIHDVPRSSNELMARHPGYESLRTSAYAIGGDTAHVQLMLQAAAPLTNVSSAREAFASVTSGSAKSAVASCALRVQTADQRLSPIFRAIFGNIETVGMHRLTIVGWPTTTDTTVALFNRQSRDSLSSQILKNGAQLDLRLVRSDVSWNGIAEERRGNTVRTEPVSLLPDRSVACPR